MIDAWPELPDWSDTRDALQLWTQIVGKVCLALAPRVNHWWGVTFRVTATGLAAPLLPYRGGAIDFSFDLQQHVLRVNTSAGAHRDIALEPRSVADFYREFRGRLGELDIDVPIFARPVEIPVAIPFEEDEQHASYDADAVTTFWNSLV